MSNETITRLGYRASECAQMFGVSESAVRAWVRNGVLPGRVIGGTVIVWRSAVDRLRAEAEAA